MKGPTFWLLAACALAISQVAIAAETAVARFVSDDGKELGEAKFTETPNGVILETTIGGLPPGAHGFHIHETGQCDAETDFESAGGHYAPRGAQHGFKQQGGPHAGDMPNQFVGEDGTLRAEVFIRDVSLSAGEATLFDNDGSAIVVHASPDDYSSQPSGDAGARLACAVIERS